MELDDRSPLDRLEAQHAALERALVRAGLRLHAGLEGPSALEEARADHDEPVTRASIELTRHAGRQALTATLVRRAAERVSRGEAREAHEAAERRVDDVSLAGLTAARESSASPQRRRALDEALAALAPPWIAIASDLHARRSELRDRLVAIAPRPAHDEAGAAAFVRLVGEPVRERLRVLARRELPLDEPLGASALAFLRARTATAAHLPGGARELLATRELTSAGLQPARVLFDAEPRPGRAPDAAIFLLAPDDVRVSLPPGGLPRDHVALFSALGAAAALRSGPRVRPHDDRYAREPAFDRAAIGLFAQAATSPSFFRRWIGAGHALAATLAADATVALLLTRLQRAALLPFARALHEHGPAQSLFSGAAEALTDATGARHGPLDAALALLGEPLPPHEAWAAEQLAAGLYDAARARLDEDFFANPRLARWLPGQLAPATAAAAGVEPRDLCAWATEALRTAA